MIDKELLLEWLADTEAATGGPWGIFRDGLDTMGGPIFVFSEESDREQGRSDSKFIALARTAMPELLAEVERLRGVIAAASDDIGAVADRDCMTYNGCNLGWHNGKDTGDQCEHCDAGEIQERLDIAIGAKP